MYRKPTFEPQSIIDVLSERDPVEQYHHLKALYQDMSAIITEIFIQMSNSVTRCLQVPVSFEWNPLRGKDYYYTRIVRDLTRKIGQASIRQELIYPMKHNWQNNMMCLPLRSERHWACWNKEATQKP